jgi:hypothetical protein
LIKIDSESKLSGMTASFECRVEENLLLLRLIMEEKAKNNKCEFKTMIRTYKKNRKLFEEKQNDITKVVVELRKTSTKKNMETKHRNTFENK